MKTFLILTTLFSSILLTCNSPKSGENGSSTTADTTSEDQSTSGETTNTIDTTGGKEYNNKAVSDLIKVATPLPNEDVQSPLTVKGQARGTWYFEAEFRVLLKDKNNKVLAQSQAIAQGPWMTEDFVPFETTLRFDPPDNEQGVLILQKANPSDRKELDQSYAIPVIFAPEK